MPIVICRLANPGEVVSTLRRIKKALRDFLFGATTYEMAKTFADLLEYNTFAMMTVLFGDMLGYPLSCYYKLKMLPLLLTRLERWKTFMLKERDLTEKLRG